jgi:hypothetical protein
MQQDCGTVRQKSKLGSDPACSDQAQAELARTNHEWVVQVSLPGLAFETWVFRPAEHLLKEQHCYAPAPFPKVTLLRWIDLNILIPLSIANADK